VLPAYDDGVILRILGRLRRRARPDIPAARDPLAVLDDELRYLTRDLRSFRARGEHAIADRLTRDIDARLEERRRLTTGRTSTPV